MAPCDKRWLKLFAIVLVLTCTATVTLARRSNENLTACQHMRRAEIRRAKAIATKIRLPRCNKKGEFEQIQCLNEKAGYNCWCVDNYGVEIPGTRNATKTDILCVEPKHCPTSSCRMFCSSGFERDSQTGCSICRCRDPCQGLKCPNGQTCHVVEVKCKSEPCPPVPTCKKARSLQNLCEAGLPLTIEGGKRPFLCGLSSSQPQCPPLYKCVVERNNEYGVCCPTVLTFEKPGVCPDPEKAEFSDRTGFMCGTPCTHDLDCPNMSKCCFTKGCQFNCQQSYNITACHQARILSDLLTISEREGRGYIPECKGPGGTFSLRQCSRNGLVCWCVHPRTGHKLQGTMGAAGDVQCDSLETINSRTLSRSFNMNNCDTQICAAVCEYGFKNDHNNCPTCECSIPCEGFKCPTGYHCEVATDPLCESGSTLCASWPICKPNLIYSNPCDVGTPLSDNTTAEIIYCMEDTQSDAIRNSAFFQLPLGLDETQVNSSTHRIRCPKNFKCTRLHHDSESVCCPIRDGLSQNEKQQTRQQTMCEYLRDFSERMEGTEEGMKLAIPAPKCTNEGNYNERQCTYRKINVTRAEQRKILEENTIRRMRMLLNSVNFKRSKRESKSLKLYRVADSALKIQLATPLIERSAKVIDLGTNPKKGLGQLFETDFKKVIPAPKYPFNSSELVELEVEECWCVDNFGTEIPQSRGFNVTDESCVKLREQLDCLDINCRMGCEYGFALDPITRCPACQCRDPCQDVICNPNGTEECRIVDVSCDDEYCPPVPACLPRKSGQCPFLVPPGPGKLDANACSYQCRTDSHCEGAKRCCSNGCGTLCVQPYMKTACQHLQAIQLHQSSELGIPAMKMHIVQCDTETGKWKPVQCSPTGFCWCVDSSGQEVSGTRTKGHKPICEVNSAFKCPSTSCEVSCEFGYKMDINGCQTCECRNICDEINCATNEECQLINVECVDLPCPKMPICVPRRESVCPEGNPLRQGELEVNCGPHNENEICPTTHTCQLNPVTNRGVCCIKTRDVCFESMDSTCLAKEFSVHNATRYRFNPKANRCLAITIDMDKNSCQTKNIFHNELSCRSVCPILTQCERLRLKNSLASQRFGHTSIWFQPRCDPVTGHWSPIQCLGNQPDINSVDTLTSHVNNANATKTLDSTQTYRVCWCADKKGAPLKGTLTRNHEPTCNSRQGRKRDHFSTSDPLMEELIRQISFLTDVDYFVEEELLKNDNVASEDTPMTTTTTIGTEAAVTEHVFELANSLLDSHLSIESIRPIEVRTTRCQYLAKTAPFPVSCDENGAFTPTQCNDKICWCVDAAGNQLESSPMFKHDGRKCNLIPISSVAVELYLNNNTKRHIPNVYDIIDSELKQLLRSPITNLRVQENIDGTALVRFELHDANKIDLAFALESTISSGDFQLAGGHYQSDITRSHFIHHSEYLPVAQATAPPDGTIQLVLFITASSTAFLISAFVVYVMLKRNKKKSDFNGYGYPIQCTSEKSINNYDKDVDCSSPIFVLNPEHDLESIKPSLDTKSS